MDKPNPLEYPELVAIVGQFVERPDRCRCLRVSRLWYNAFLPLVWESVSLLPNARKPASVPLARFAHLVKDLVYHANIRTKYDQIEYPNLKSLKVRIFPARCTWTPSYLRSLSTLEVQGIDVTMSNSIIFWNLCEQLRRVTEGDEVMRGWEM